MNITYLDTEKNKDYVKILDDSAKCKYKYSGNTVDSIKISYKRLAIQFTSDPSCCTGHGFSLSFRAVIGMKSPNTTE